MELCGFSFQPKWSREIELLQVRILALACGSGGRYSLYQPQIRFPSDIAVWFVNMLTPTQSGFRQMSQVYGGGSVLPRRLSGLAFL